MVYFIEVTGRVGLQGSKLTKTIILRSAYELSCRYSNDLKRLVGYSDAISPKHMPFSK